MAQRSALLCLDGSDAAREAILGASKLLSDQVVLVLSVWQPAAALTGLDPIGDTVGDLSGIYREMDEIGERLARQRAEEGTAIASEAGLQGEPLTARGNPAREILRIADERDASVIVLGARAGGLGTVSSIVLGSVSARILHHCARPVLVIPSSQHRTAPEQPTRRRSALDQTAV